PDGRAILSGSAPQVGQGEVRLWSADTGQPLSPPLPHPGKLTALAYCSDGRAIVTGCERPDNKDGSFEARVWELALDAPAGVVQKQLDSALLNLIEGPGFSGHFKLGKSGNGSLRLQDVINEGPGKGIVERPIGPALIHPGGISAFTLNLDGTMALTG